MPLGGVILSGHSLRGEEKGRLGEELCEWGHGGGDNIWDVIK